MNAPQLPPLAIVRGKFYRQRNGQRLEILTTSRCDKKAAVPNCMPPIIGINDFGQMYEFTADGRWAGVYPGESSAMDIVEPWIDRPVVDWTAMPRWATAVAMDADGEWWFFEEPPSINRFNLWNSNAGAMGKIPPKYAPQWTDNWRHSLVVRPEPEPTQTGPDAARCERCGKTTLVALDGPGKIVCWECYVQKRTIK